MPHFDTIEFIHVKSLRPFRPNPSLFKIAVTGGAGSGKTAVCNRLQDWGLNVISADALSREVVLPGTPAFNKIVSSFGSQVLQGDGTLNRQMLRRSITESAAAKEKLEKIVQPEIIRRMHQKIEAAEKAGEATVVVEVPLLFELGLEDEFDLVILVSVDYDVQVVRVMARDHVTREEAEALLNIQMPEKKKIERSEIVIDNNGTIEDLLKSVDSLYQEYIKKMMGEFEIA